VGGAAQAPVDEATTSCDDWAGETVAVLLCDEPTLRAAFAAGTLGQPGAASLHADGRAAASAPGVAQLVGGPLRPGERVVVDTAPPAATLVVRALGAAGATESRVALDGATGPLTITVSGDEQAAVVVHTATGRALSAARTLRPPARPRHVRVRRAGRRVWIAFQATTSRTLVQLRDGRGRTPREGATGHPPGSPRPPLGGAGPRHPDRRRRGDARRRARQRGATVRPRSRGGRI
jgi:hypothetical protein